MGARYGPQPPTRSSRPGQAVTLLGHPPTPGGPDMAPSPHTFVASRPSLDAPRSPAHSGGPRDGPQPPTRSSRPGQAVTLLGHPLTPGGPEMAPNRHGLAPAPQNEMG